MEAHEGTWMDDEYKDNLTEILWRIGTSNAHSEAPDGRSGSSIMANEQPGKGKGGRSGGGSRREKAT